MVARRSSEKRHAEMRVVLMHNLIFQNQFFVVKKIPDTLWMNNTARSKFDQVIASPLGK